MATTVGGGFVYTSIVGPQGLDSVSGSGPPSPVLLPNLVAGWALTSGPQQTLSSAGVISGGALDFIADPAITYDPSKGAVCATTSSVAFKVGGASLDMTTQPVFTHCIVERILNQDTFCAFLQFQSYPSADVTQFYTEADWQASPSVYSVVFTVDNNPTIAGVPTSSGPFGISSWSSISGAVNGVNISPGPGPTTQPKTVPWNDWGAFQPGVWLCAELAPNVYVKYPRIWIGSNAQTIIDSPTIQSWLDNVVGGVALGRTDAEVAAYTG